MNAFDVRRILYNPESNDSNGPPLLSNPAGKMNRYFRVAVIFG